MTNERQQVILTIEEAQALMGYWQEVLRLQDWTVILEICRREDLYEGTQGQCEMTFRRKEARIKILDPTDYPTKDSIPQDMEATLVHELLHLHFVGFDLSKVDSREDDLLEQTINALSYALVGLKRKAQA